MKKFIITTIFAIITVASFSQDYITANTDIYVHRKCIGFYDSETKEKEYPIKTNYASLNLEYNHEKHEVEVWIKKYGNKVHYKKFNNVKLIVEKYNEYILGYMVLSIDDKYKYAAIDNEDMKDWYLFYMNTKIK